MKCLIYKTDKEPIQDEYIKKYNLEKHCYIRSHNSSNGYSYEYIININTLEDIFNLYNDFKDFYISKNNYNNDYIFALVIDNNYLGYL